MTYSLRYSIPQLSVTRGNHANERKRGEASRKQVMITFLKMAERKEGSPTCRKQSIPTIRKVLKNISEEITDTELHKLIFLAGDHLPKGQTQNMNCLQFIGALEERQLIDTQSQDLEYMLDLLNDLPRHDLVKKLMSVLPVRRSNQKIITEEVREVNCDVTVVSNCSSSVTIESSTMRSVLSQYDNTDGRRNGGFLQEPDLLNSTFQNYNETIAQLESVTLERDELWKRVNSLEIEMNMTRDDQNNLICERNNAIAAKAELAFRESEAKRELSELKRSKYLLEKNLSQTIEKKEEDIKELKEKLEKSEEERKELKTKLEDVYGDKKLVEEKLHKMESKMQKGNGRIKCKRCGLLFLETNNPPDACRYHSGKYEIIGSLMKKLEWSCCKSTNRNTPGCCKKKHLSINYQISNVSQGCRTERLETM